MLKYALELRYLSGVRGSKHAVLFPLDDVNDGCAVAVDRWTSMLGWHFGQLWVLMLVRIVFAVKLCLRNYRYLSCYY